MSEFLKKISIKSIKTKLIASILTVVILVIAVNVAINQRNTNIALSAKIAENMQLNSETAAEGIAKEISSVRTALEVIVIDEKVRRMEIATVVPRLSEIKKKQPKFEILFICDLNGNYYPDNRKNGSIADRAYFKEALLKKTTVVAGEPVISKSTGSMVLPILVPILDDAGTLKGFLGGPVNLNSLKEYVLSRKFGKDGYTFAVAQNGLVFIHPDEKKVLKLNLFAEGINSALRDMASSAVSGQKGSMEYEFEGIKKFSGYAHVEGTSWGVVTTMSKAEAMSMVTESRNMSILVGLAILALSGIAVYFLASRISRPIVTIKDISEKIADGDLSLDIHVSLSDEIGMLQRSMNTMSGRLSEIVSNISSNAAFLATASEQMSVTSQNLSSSTNEQAANLEEITSTLEQIGAAVSNSAENSRLTDNLAQDSAREAEEVGKSVVETVETMKKISDKIRLIEDIAYQTNLLALNAAIEAARAGEHGKGFAVVAGEVRKLAEKSQLASQEISDITRSSVDVSSRAMALIDNIVPKIKKTAQLVQGITSASGEQDAGVSQIAAGMSQLNELTQQNAAAAEELAATAESLSGQSVELNRMLSYFRIKGDERLAIGSGDFAGKKVF